MHYPDPSHNPSYIVYQAPVSVSCWLLVPLANETLHVYGMVSSGTAGTASLPLYYLINVCSSFRPTLNL